MDVSGMIDELVDRTVVLGYGKVGLLVRRRLPSWPADPPRMDGKVVIVTGAASGLGLAAAGGFARLGATVHVVARTQPRAEQALEQIRRGVPGADVRPEACDVSSLGELSAFARRFAEQKSRLDVLVNNAGVMPDERERSTDGNELMFATHVLGPFALIALFSDLLERSAPARVINVSSGGMYSQSLRAEDLQSERTSYGPQKLYARTKREEVVITELWAQRLQRSGVVVHSMHPGWADSKGIQQAMPLFRALTRPILRTAEEGADTIVWLGAAPVALESTGQFWHDRRPRPTHYLLGASEDSEQDRRALWDLCQSLLDRTAPEQ